MIQPAFEILNQRGTPMFFSDVFANRPTAGIVGRIFISTDTYAFYRDTGSGWDLIGGPGSGTITGSGTIGTLPIWNGTQVIGDSSLLEGASKFTTTKDFQADGYYLSGMTAGSGALYWTSDRVTLANYNPTGDVHIEVAGGQAAQVVLGSNLSTTFYGNIIRNGGLSTQFLKADGSLDSSNYITTNIYNANGTLTGNRDVSLNSNYLSFAGGQTYIGSQTTSSGLLTINNSSADAHVQVVGANSPSIRIDNAGTGATRRFVMGLSTATNNFIQGSTPGDICISSASASPMLFGMWQTINASEVMRISTSNNLIIGSSTDNGNRLQVNGNIYAGNTGGDTTIQVQSFSGSGSSNLRLINTSSTVQYDWNIQGLGADGRFRIYDNAGTTGEWFTILQNGNTGIGTSSPSFKLQVDGVATSGFVTSIVAKNPSTNGASATKIGFDSGGTIWGEIGSSYNSNDPYMAFFVRANNEKMRITDSGNLGLGVTPSAWSIGSPVFQLGNSGVHLFGAGTQAQLGSNTFYNGSAYIYVVNGSATRYFQNSTAGEHQWENSISGTAGGTITFTERLKISAVGDLYVNRTATTANLYLGYNFYIQNDQSPEITSFVNSSGSSIFRWLQGSTPTERMRLSPSGNLLLNTASDTGFKFNLNGSLRIDGQTSGTAGGNSGQHLIINCDGTTYKIALLNP